MATITDDTLAWYGFDEAGNGKVMVTLWGLSGDLLVTSGDLMIYPLVIWHSYGEWMGMTAWTLDH